MPYIDKARRDDIHYAANHIDLSQITSPGELVFALTVVCWETFKDSEQRFADLNAIIGALENTKLEFYRRVSAPYEDDKIEENGDVYNS
jgi:hypothetical protein